MDGNRIYLVLEEVDYDGHMDVHICKDLNEVIQIFERFDIVEKKGNRYLNKNDKWGFDYLIVSYRDLNDSDTVVKTFDDNIFEIKDKIVQSKHQQSALGAILSAKVGLKNVNSYEVVHDKNFMITDLNISLNTRDQAIINNTHREVGIHFAANVYGININITKPKE